MDVIEVKIFEKTCVEVKIFEKMCLFKYPGALECESDRYVHALWILSYAYR